MLELLTIKNFQKHKKKEVKLSQVTTIVGPTESGKSTLVRALRWICLNKPGGTAFVKHGAKEAKAILVVDGYKVERLRGSANVYKLDGEKYVSFKNDVPADIAALLGVDEVNFQRQLDQPYWLAESPGQVARNLNAIVDLDCVDHALTYASKEARDARQAAEFTGTRLIEAEGELDALSHVPELQGLFDDAGQACDAMISLEAQVEDLGSIMSGVAESQAAGQGVQEELEMLDGVVQACEAWQDSLRIEDLLCDMMDHWRDLMEECAHSCWHAEGYEYEIHDKLKGKECPLCHSIVK